MLTRETAVAAFVMAVITSNAAARACDSSVCRGARRPIRRHPEPPRTGLTLPAEAAEAKVQRGRRDSMRVGTEPLDRRR